MKRYNFFLGDRDHERVLRGVDAEGSSFSEFVRQAVLEKLDRDQVIHQVADVREDLGQLVEQMREEVMRTRKDLVEDGRRSLDLLREDAAQQMQRMAELNKAFVLMQGRLAAEESAGQAPTRRAATPPVEHDDTPKQIPGPRPNPMR